MDLISLWQRVIKIIGFFLAIFDKHETEPYTV